ncbi:MAG: methylenetetrahydrofolate reductase [NAD(P)H], partial [Zetaproteobacteria bacterium]|nr:methylenetetrahydrofolate reductase [NAD(P)H] [Pseudobdellovibrionaceae bacterium]
MKIIDKINQSIVENKPFFSLEFFPPKTKAGIQNLYDRLERMARLEPAFVDFTWGAGGSTSQLTLELCQSAQKYFALEVMMHLTCTNISEAEIRSALNSARDAGIKNILALRGDPPVGSERWVKRDDGFAFGADLTGFIRTEFDDWFGVGVAGYPGGHPESASLESDI